LPVHAAEEEVGAALERKVKMGNDLWVGFEGGKQFIVQVTGFEAGEAEADQAGDAGAEGLDELGQGCGGIVGFLASAEGCGVAVRTEEDTR